MNLKRIWLLLIICLSVVTTTEASNFNPNYVTIGKSSGYYLLCDTSQEYLIYDKPNIIVDVQLGLDMGDQARESYARAYGDVYRNAAYIMIHGKWVMNSNTRTGTFERICMKVYDNNNNLICQAYGEPIDTDSDVEFRWWLDCVMEHIKGRLATDGVYIGDNGKISKY